MNIYRYSLCLYFVYIQLGIQLMKTFLGARSWRKACDTLQRECRESGAQLHPRQSSASCKEDETGLGSRMTEDHDPARSAEIKWTKAGCRRLCLRPLLKQRISKGVRDGQGVSGFILFVQHIKYIHWIMLLCSLEQQWNKPAGLPEFMEDEVRRESKARTEETLTQYLQFRGEEGTDWEQRLSKCLCEAALS